MFFRSSCSNCKAIYTECRWTHRKLMEYVVYDVLWIPWKFIVDCFERGSLCHLYIMYIQQNRHFARAALEYMVKKTNHRTPWCFIEYSLIIMYTSNLLVSGKATTAATTEKNKKNNTQHLLPHTDTYIAMYFVHFEFNMLH